MEGLLDLLGQLSPGLLLDDPRSAPGPVYPVLLGVFVVAFIVGLVLTIGSNRLSRGNRLQRRLIGRYGTWAAWLAGAGIVIIGLRYTNVALLSKRLWAALDILAMLAVAAHFVWYRVRRYPAEIAAYREEERKRRFLPSQRRAAAAARRVQRRRR